LTKTSKIFVVLLPLAILAGGFYFATNQKTSDTTKSVGVTDQITPGSIESSQSPQAAPRNPLATKAETPSDSSNQVRDQTSLSSQQIADSITPASASSDSTQTISRSTNTTQVSDDLALKVDRYTDNEFRRMETRLSTDTALRMQLLEEFRNYPDSNRAKQIAALLGPFDDPEIIETASMLVYSGDSNSQRMGLELLSRMQPHSDDARNIAIDLLSSVDDAATLVSTMNVLAIPAKDANAEQRQLLADNTYNLSNHRDPRVRSHSLSIMSRWQKNAPNTVTAIERGLTDPEAAVRSSAVYASENMTSASPALINNLLTIAENIDEKRTVRSAAVRAISTMTLDSTQMRRFRIARANISRRGQ